MMVTKLYAFMFFAALAVTLDSSADDPHPASIIQDAIAALDGLETVRYTISRDQYSNGGTIYAGMTSITATRDPFRFTARHGAEELAISDQVVSDGQTTWAVDNGRIMGEMPTFHPVKKWTMTLQNTANADVAATFQLLARPTYLANVLNDKSLLYAGRDDIDGDLCHVILWVINGADELFGNYHTTLYLWVSASTGLPRAVQYLRRLRGRTRLSDQYILSSIEINPSVPNDLFRRPTDGEADSEKLPIISETTHARLHEQAKKTRDRLVGSPLPDLHVKDLDSKPRSLDRFVGKPMIVTFWATWCGPCIAEFPALQSLVKDHNGELVVLAIAVKDSRINVSEYIAENKNFDFHFLTDPQMQTEQSKLLDAFDIRGIPVNLIVDYDGTIVEYFVGARSETEWRTMIDPILNAR